MSRHGQNARAKARANGRLKKWWCRHYGRPHKTRRWHSPPASSIRALQKRNLELYGNANPSRRKRY